MPIYVARRLNASGVLRNPLPSLGPDDFIYNPSFKKERFQGEWLLIMQNITTGSNTTRVEHGQREWENMVNESNWMCFKRAVHVSPFPITSPDPEIAFEYRQKLYEHMGMRMPSGPPPQKVLFWLRPDTGGRAFDTLDGMVDVCKRYGIEYT